MNRAGSPEPSVGSALMQQRIVPVQSAEPLATNRRGDGPGPCGGSAFLARPAPARKPAAFREAAIHAAVEAMALPVPAVWGVLEAGGRQPHHGCPLGRPRNGAWVFCTRPIRISPDLAVFAG